MRFPRPPRAEGREVASLGSQSRPRGRTPGLRRRNSAPGAFSHAHPAACCCRVGGSRPPGPASGGRDRAANGRKQGFLASSRRGVADKADLVALLAPGKRGELHCPRPPPAATPAHRTLYRPVFVLYCPDSALYSSHSPRHTSPGSGNTYRQSQLGGGGGRCCQEGGHKRRCRRSPAFWLCSDMPATPPETGCETGLPGNMSLQKLIADITKGEEAKACHGSSLTAIERPSKVTKKRYLRPEAPHVGVAVAAQGAALQNFFALPGPVRCPTCTLE